MIADPSKYSNMVVAMKDIYAKEGLKGLWAGNVLNCLRIGPQMGIAFFAKDYFKTMYAGEGNKPTPLQTLAASMSSGICCQTGIYPLDLIRTRMMTSPGAYTGFGDCISQTISKEGLSALYKGLLPANMFAVPYYGTQFFCVRHTQAAILYIPEALRRSSSSTSTSRYSSWRCLFDDCVCDCLSIPNGVETNAGSRCGRPSNSVR